MQDFTSGIGVIGITAGSFDLTHAGHILMLEECKNACDYLIVCLQTDPTIDRPDTKNIPVQSIFERHLQLRSCRYVDEIMVYATEEDLTNIFLSIHYDVRFLGEDWSTKLYTGKRIPGMEQKVKFNSRHHGYSTSSLRKRVYDAEVSKSNN